ncbi:MAG: L-serine ammonia-lyase, partial [Hyphomicrobiaceae bacterium]
CVDRGLTIDGVLPGGLNVRRRAKGLYQKAIDDQSRNMTFPHHCMDRISAYAIAVNEENAAGSRVVTSPTNGAAGVIPAVLRYYMDMCPGADRGGVHIFLLSATAFGSIIKQNASLSGAEVGCQGEVGSASAMGAAGLCAALGGTPGQIENAAEIALEHHLGMTCDPVGGLVQVPCIERNAMGAVKAINAASLALAGDGEHIVSFDAVVETMRQTGLDLQSKYKETSQGGLAVTVVAC